MRILFAALAALVFVPHAQAAPLEAYARPPALQDVNLSPDGSKLAYLRRQGDSPTVVIKEAQGAKLLGGFSLGGQLFRALDWAGPDHIWVASFQTVAFAKGNTIGGRYLQIQIYDIAAKTFRPVLSENLTLIQDLPEYRVVDGKPTLFIEGRTFNGAPQANLFRIDVATGQTQAVDKVRLKPDEDPTWLVDSAGRPATRTDYNTKTGLWALMLPDASGGWRSGGQLTDPVRRPHLASFGPEPGVALGFRREGEVSLFRKVSLADGAWGEAVPLAFDLRGWISDAATQVLVGVNEGRETAGTRFFDPKEQAAWNRLVDTFKGDSVMLWSWSDDRNLLVAYVEGGTTGAAYVLLDRDKGTSQVLGPVYDGLSAADISQPRWISYKAADGLDITGVLTLPKGRDPKGLPLVVLPHDGPQDRDIVQFHWLAQALASRGYAVFQPNYRGSGGFGPAFVNAGHGEWGRKMQSDVSDGVRHLIAHGVADAGRVCVVGRGGYGGYVALAGVTLEQGLYRCAVSIGGISDINGMMDWMQSRTSGSDNNDLRMFRVRVGVERGEQGPRDAISPAKHAARADAPILLIHAPNDGVVPADQSARMAKALQAAGRQSELIDLTGGDNALFRGDSRIRALKATVEFLERHNPPA